MVNEEVEWFFEFFFYEGNVSGIFRYINCVCVGYVGIFVDGMCLNCFSIDKINIFCCKVWCWVKESNFFDLMNKVCFEFLLYVELCERFRGS